MKKKKKYSTHFVVADAASFITACIFPCGLCINSYLFYGDTKATFFPRVFFVMLW